MNSIYPTDSRSTSTQLSSNETASVSNVLALTVAYAFPHGHLLANSLSAFYGLRSGSPGYCIYAPVTLSFLSLSLPRLCLRFCLVPGQIRAHSGEQCRHRCNRKREGQSRQEKARTEEGARIFPSRRPSICITAGLHNFLPANLFFMALRGRVTRRPPDYFITNAPPPRWLGAVLEMPLESSPA